MPFSETVKTELLVKSRRSCCICHRFKGTNLEVHHIVPEAQGGSNVASNGIPVCFDCHADVEHYNSKHPKGSKYSVTELKKHRENWFDKVAATGVDAATPMHADIDRRIAAEIHTHMTESESYAFLRDHDLGASYPGRRTDPLFRLEYKFHYPDLEFMDSDLEAQRAAFASDLSEAVNAIANLTSPMKGDPDWYSVGSEYELLTSPRYAEIKQEIDEANDLCSRAAVSYLELYNLIRRKLGVDLRFT